MKFHAKPTVIKRKKDYYYYYKLKMAKYGHHFRLTNTDKYAELRS